MYANIYWITSPFYTYKYSMSQQTQQDLFGSLKETFSLGIREFARTLTGTMPDQAAPMHDSSGKPADPNQISLVLGYREDELSKTRF